MTFSISMCLYIAFRLKREASASRDHAAEEVIVQFMYSNYYQCTYVATL